MTNPFEILSAEMSDMKSILLNIQQSLNENKPGADQLLTIEQAEKLIHLKVKTIRGYVSRNEIPFSKTGKRLYFSKLELMDWIKTGRKKTIAEIKNEVENPNRKSS